MGRLALTAAALAAALAASPAPALPQGWYRSDSIGLALEPLPGPRRGEAWLLAVEHRGELEVRTLYEQGRESRRWELSPGLERVYAGGSLAEERSYDGAGRLAAERIFAEGSLRESRQYRYGLAGLAGVEARGADGELLARERYELGAGGELRRVRRETVGAPAAEELSLVTAGGRLYEERLSGGGRGLISRYDAEGQVSSQETWQDRRLLESVERTWAGRLPVSEQRSAGGTRTVSRYDAQGREASRLVSRDGRTLEEWSYRYDAAGNRTQAQRVDERGLELWRYEYDASGRLRREEHRVRGQLQEVVRYEEGARVEELYRAGLPFLVVTYRDGVKVLEEFLEGGQVVRRRQFGGGP